MTEYEPQDEVPSRWIYRAEEIEYRETGVGVHGTLRATDKDALADGIAHLEEYYGQENINRDSHSGSSFGTAGMRYGKKGSRYFQTKGWKGGNREGDPSLS